MFWLQIIITLPYSTQPNTPLLPSLFKIRTPPSPPSFATPPPFFTIFIFILLQSPHTYMFSHFKSTIFLVPLPFLFPFLRKSSLIYSVLCFFMLLRVFFRRVFHLHRRRTTADGGQEVSL